MESKSASTTAAAAATNTSKSTISGPKVVVYLGETHYYFSDHGKSLWDGLLEYFKIDGSKLAREEVASRNPKEIDFVLIGGVAESELDPLVSKLDRGVVKTKAGTVVGQVDAIKVAANDERSPRTIWVQELIKREPQWAVADRDKKVLAVTGGLVVYRFRNNQFEMLLAQEKSKRVSYTIMSGRRKRPTDASPLHMAVREFLDETHVLNKNSDALLQAAQQSAGEPLMSIESTGDAHVEYLIELPIDFDDKEALQVSRQRLTKDANEYWAHYPEKTWKEKEAYLWVSVDEFVTKYRYRAGETQAIQNNSGAIRRFFDKKRQERGLPSPAEQSPKSRKTNSTTSPPTKPVIQLEPEEDGWQSVGRFKKEKQQQAQQQQQQRRQNNNNNNNKDASTSSTSPNTNTNSTNNTSAASAQKAPATRPPPGFEPKEKKEEKDNRSLSTTTIYVSNLPWDFDNGRLEKFFVDNGFEVKKARVLKDKDQLRSKGVGFVEFTSEEMQKKALDSMRGKEVNGRSLTVRPAHVQTDEDESKPQKGNKQEKK